MYVALAADLYCRLAVRPEIFIPADHIVAQTSNNWMVSGRPIMPKLKLETKLYWRRMQPRSHMYEEQPALLIASATSASPPETRNPSDEFNLICSRIPLAIVKRVFMGFCRAVLIIL